MKKILLVGGDSFSDQGCNSYKGTNIITWPILLAKKLDMDLVCVAQSGAGNEQIYSSILDWICKNGSNNIGMVIAAWSKCERMDWELIDGPWHNARVFPKGNIYSWLKKSIRNFYNLQILCENHNIPYKQCQMISLFTDHIGEYFPLNFKAKKIEMIECMINSPQFNLIKKSNFIGWPICAEHNGFVVSDITVHNDIKLEYVIGPNDPHPNKKGHKMIMEFIYENL